MKKIYMAIIASIAILLIIGLAFDMLINMLAVIVVIIVIFMTISIMQKIRPREAKQTIKKIPEIKIEEKQEQKPSVLEESVLPNQPVEKMPVKFTTQDMRKQFPHLTNPATMAHISMKIPWVLSAELSIPVRDELMKFADMMATNGKTLKSHNVKPKKIVKKKKRR